MRDWMRVDSQRIVAQLPPKMASQRLRPTTSEPEPSPEQQRAHLPDRLLRIALDGTQRAPRGAPRVLAEPRELARGQLLDLPALVLQPRPQPFGQVAHA